MPPRLGASGPVTLPTSVPGVHSVARYYHEQEDFGGKHTNGRIAVCEKAWRNLGGLPPKLPGWQRLSASASAPGSLGSSPPKNFAKSHSYKDYGTSQTEHFYEEHWQSEADLALEAGRRWRAKRKLTREQAFLHEFIVGEQAWAGKRHGGSGAAAVQRPLYVGDRTLLRLCRRAADGRKGVMRYISKRNMSEAARERAVHTIAMLRALGQHDAARRGCPQLLELIGAMVVAADGFEATHAYGHRHAIENDRQAYCVLERFCVWSCSRKAWVPAPSLQAALAAREEGGGGATSSTSARLPQRQQGVLSAAQRVRVEEVVSSMLRAKPDLDADALRARAEMVAMEEEGLEETGECDCCAREQETRNVLRQLLGAVAHMHAAGVCHRNICPANLMVKGGGEEQQGQEQAAGSGTAGAPVDLGSCVLKVVGLGDAKKHDRLRMSKHPLEGSFSVEEHAHIAPELLRVPCSFNELVDEWAAGIIGYQVRYGEHPFVTSEVTGHDLPSSKAGELVKGLLSGSPPFPRCRVAGCNADRECRRLLASLLQRKPSARLSASKALRHPFFAIEDASAARPKVREVTSAPSLHSSAAAADDDDDDSDGDAEDAMIPEAVTIAIPKLLFRGGCSVLTQLSANAHDLEHRMQSGKAGSVSYLKPSTRTGLGESDRCFYLVTVERVTLPQVIDHRRTATEYTHERIMLEHNANVARQTARLLSASAPVAVAAEHAGPGGACPGFEEHSLVEHRVLEFTFRDISTGRSCHRRIFPEHVTHLLHWWSAFGCDNVPPTQARGLREHDEAAYRSLRAWRATGALPQRQQALAWILHQMVIRRDAKRMTVAMHELEGGKFWEGGSLDAGSKLNVKPFLKLLFDETRTIQPPPVPVPVVAAVREPVSPPQLSDEPVTAYDQPEEPIVEPENIVGDVSAVVESLAAEAEIAGVVVDDLSADTEDAAVASSVANAEIMGEVSAVVNDLAAGTEAAGAVSAVVESLTAEAEIAGVVGSVVDDLSADAEAAAVASSVVESLVADAEIMGEVSAVVNDLVTQSAKVDHHMDLDGAQYPIQRHTDEV